MADFINGMCPIHPGEVLREEFLIPFGLSAHALAIALQVPAPLCAIRWGVSACSSRHTLNVPRDRIKT